MSLSRAATAMAIMLKKRNARRAAADALQNPETRNIQLGLERMLRVIDKKQKWKAIHVAGTNGKGSICSILAHMFMQTRFRFGLFTSPPVLGEPHGIQISIKPVSDSVFNTQVQLVKRKSRDATGGIPTQQRKLPRGAEYNEVLQRATDKVSKKKYGSLPDDLTPFEIETAVAFRMFDAANVHVGIIEVGMGGATDATNAVRRKDATVISKIGLDHQEYLGNTLQEIAKVKAGIMRPLVPCIIDHTNPPEALDVLVQHAQRVGAPCLLTSEATDLLDPIDTNRIQLEDFEKQNLLCALMAYRACLPETFERIDLNRLLKKGPFPPGRKDRISVNALLGDGHQRKQPILVDGAHNMLGVQTLAKYVDEKLRPAAAAAAGGTDQPVTWIIGFSASEHKKPAELMAALVRPHDRVAFVAYVPRENEPPPFPVEQGCEIANRLVSSPERVMPSWRSVLDAIIWACDQAGDDGVIVVTGSLYLIRELYSNQCIKRVR